MKLPAAFVVVACAWGTAYADETKHPPYEPLWIRGVTASSTLASKTNAYAPVLAVDPKQTYLPRDEDWRIDSSWCEGNADEGIGESLAITFERPTKLDKMSIKAGVWKTQKLFDASNVITGLDVTTDDGRKLSVVVPPTRDEVDVKLGGAPISSLTLIITAVKKGKKNDSCISEITFDEHVVATGYDPAATSAYAGALRDIHTALWGGCDEKLIAKYFDFPFTFVALENVQADDYKKRRHKLKNAAAFATLCRNGDGLDGSGPSSPERDTVDAAYAGTVDLTVELADVVHTIHMAWRVGQWHVTKID